METIATHFVHLVLSYEAVQNLRLNAEERELFIAGSLLPDAAGANDKKLTHLSLGKDPNSLEAALAKTPYWLEAGWRFHLELDRIWQRTCLWSNLFRLPLIYLRYRHSASSKYYEELSALDVVLRRSMSEKQLNEIESLLDKLQSVEPPPNLPIDPLIWREFLLSLKHDLKKEDVFVGSPIVGLRRFNRFSRKSRQWVEHQAPLWRNGRS